MSGSDQDLCNKSSSVPSTSSRSTPTFFPPAKFPPAKRGRGRGGQLGLPVRVQDVNHLVHWFFTHRHSFSPLTQAPG